MSRRRDDVGDPVPPSPALRLVCHVDATERGGSTASLVTLLGALDPAIDVTVMGTSREIVDWVAGARPGTSTRVLSPVRSKFDLRSIREHTRAVREIAPDILHVNLDNTFTGQYGLLVGALTGSTTVAVVHSNAPPWRRRQQWLVRRLARHVTAYVAVSAAVARTVETFLAMAEGSVRVIHNGADSLAAVATPAEGSAPVIGAVGRL
ncbi:MAG TPA: glycosyltransferase, partial [Acidimicrobiales bacterium]|nr:glycosyltransferase [Acidimicrobiales bacterium]